MISADTDWTSTSPLNLFFNNVTIEAAQTLTVPSGTTIYCTGTFINNGLILVQDSNNLAGLFSGISNLRTTTPATISLKLTIRSPDIGDAASSASNGSWSPNSVQSFSGGIGGNAMQEAAIRSSIGRLYRGGGAGGGGSSRGASGGGALRVLCKGDISNNGEITANGRDASTGGGGGGGGIIVLASQTSVQHLGTGTLTANGGNGGDSVVFSNVLRGAAGGGGGGIVALIAPTLVNVGATNVTGGTGGVGTTLTNDSDRMSGGGGGASGGNGGSGGFMNPGTSATAFDGTDGLLGITVLIAANPEALF